MNKNYCREHEVQNRNNGHKDSSWKEILRAFLTYLQRPKTLFDLKDRTRAVILLVVIIIVTQYLLKMLLK